MTIEKARQLLGKEAIGKTDEDIQNIIGNLTVLADVGFEMFEKGVRLDNVEQN